MPGAPIVKFMDIFHKSRYFISIFTAVSAITISSPSSAQEVWKELNQLPDEAKLAAVEDGARQEGSVVVYAAMGIDRAEIFLAPFRKEYPDVSVDFVRLTVVDLLQKVTMESRAGRGAGDVVITTVPWLDLLKDYLAPYEPTSWQHFDRRFVHGGADEGWAATTFELLLDAIAWRTDKVAEDEAPRTLAEMADPKWNGRAGTILSQERTIDGLVHLLGEEKGMDLVRQLAALNNRIYPSIGALTQALAGGEVDVAWAIGAYRAAALKNSGAPVDWAFPKPLFATGDMVAVLKGGPNPHAGALFAEFMTKAQTLEMSDKAEPGRAFGNTAGTYEVKMGDLGEVYINPPLPEDRYRELNRIAEELFVRRQK